MPSEIDWIGISQVITAIGVLISVMVSAYNNIRLREVSAKVDGAATAQTTKIETLTSQISDLKGTISEQKQTAAVKDAQSESRTRMNQTSPAPVAVIPIAPTILAQDKVVKEIASNTKEIAENTKDLKEK